MSCRTVPKWSWPAGMRFRPNTRSSGCCSRPAAASPAPNFARTHGYRAMWQKEKDRLEEMDAALFQRVMSGERMVALTVFSGQRPARGRRTPQGQMSFLESTAAVLAIALNNALLYEALEKKAQRDPLTNLYNRSYFQDHILEEFELCRHEQLSLMIVSFGRFPTVQRAVRLGRGRPHPQTLWRSAVQPDRRPRHGRALQRQGVRGQLPVRLGGRRGGLRRTCARLAQRESCAPANRRASS